MATWKLARPSLLRVWHAYRILLVVPLIMQVHLVVERRLASVVDPRAIAALDYARFVSDTAVLLLATPFAMAGLASMAVLAEPEFRQKAQKSMRLLLCAGIPISVAITIHGYWLVRVAFGRGAFDDRSVAVTGQILQALGVGIWAQLTGYAGARFLSARGKNRTVLAIYAVAISVNIALNLALARRLGPTALGLSYAANSLVMGVAVLYELKVAKALWRDAAVLIGGAVGYACLWSLLPAATAARFWVPPAYFLLYWGSAFVTVGTLRTTMFEALRTLQRH